MRARQAVTVLAVVCGIVTALVAGCGHGPAPASVSPRPAGALATALPPGVMPAARACRLVIGREPRGFFTGIERVHLVLTTYAKGEPVESQGDISSGMPPGTMVWVIEVHAKAINWNHSMPAGDLSQAQPDTDYSVVMNARTGRVSDSGQCRCWPLPLGQAGLVISLAARC